MSLQKQQVNVIRCLSRGGTTVVQHSFMPSSSLEQALLRERPDTRVGCKRGLALLFAPSGMRAACGGSVAAMVAAFCGSEPGSSCTVWPAVRKPCVESTRSEACVAVASSSSLIEVSMLSAIAPEHFKL